MSALAGLRHQFAGLNRTTNFLEIVLEFAAFRDEHLESFQIWRNRRRRGAQFVNQDVVDRFFVKVSETDTQHISVRVEKRLEVVFLLAFAKNVADVFDGGSVVQVLIRANELEACQEDDDDDDRDADWKRVPAVCTRNGFELRWNHYLSFAATAARC